MRQDDDVDEEEMGDDEDEAPAEEDLAEDLRRKDQKLGRS